MNGPGARDLIETSAHVATTRASEHVSLCLPYAKHEGTQWRVLSRERGIVMLAPARASVAPACATNGDGSSKSLVKTLWFDLHDAALPAAAWPASARCSHALHSIVLRPCRPTLGNSLRCTLTKTFLGRSRAGLLPSEMRDVQQQKSELLEDRATD
jgi:hypothetical protein